MNRAEMVNAIYAELRIRSELISRELWQQLAEMTDAEIEQKYKEVCDGYLSELADKLDKLTRTTIEATEEVD